MRRRLGIGGAVFMGLGAMVGTGVFVSIGVAASVAGPAVILAIGIAAGVALCNALSSAQLAAAHPVSGGTYEYGYRWLNPAMGFTAGWMFLCAKTASAATAALGFAGYAIDLFGDNNGSTKMVALALAAVISLTVIVLCGLRRANWLNILIVSITLGALATFVIAGVPGAVRGMHEHLTPFLQPGDDANRNPLAALLEATALMFVAFTGYGRIATMGEEVVKPQRTIPRAIIASLCMTGALYMAVAFVAVTTLGAPALADLTRRHAAPLEVIARTFDWPGASAVVAIGAITAMLGVLLNLIIGLSRVLLAMGRRGDAPSIVAKLDHSHTTPWVAVIVVGAAVGGLTLIGNVKTTWSFSAFTVLIYYAITNAAALRLPHEHRLYPRTIAWIGLTACLSLAFWVDWRVWVLGVGLLAAGLVWHVGARRIQTSRARSV